LVFNVRTVTYEYKYSVWQNAEFLNITADGTQGYCRILKS